MGDSEPTPRVILVEETDHGGTSTPAETPETLREENPFIPSHVGSHQTKDFPQYELQEMTNAPEEVRCSLKFLE
jgi:hypothetical protein